MHKNRYNAPNFLISALLYIVNINKHLWTGLLLLISLILKKKKKSRIVPNWRKFWVLTLLLYLWSPSFRRMKASAKPSKGMFLPSRSVMVTCPFHSWFLHKESESRMLRMKLDWKASWRHKTVIHPKPGVYAHADSEIIRSKRGTSSSSQQARNWGHKKAKGFLPTSCYSWLCEGTIIHIKTASAHLVKLPERSTPANLAELQKQQSLSA